MGIEAGNARRPCRSRAFRVPPKLMRSVRGTFREDHRGEVAHGVHPANADAERSQARSIAIEHIDWRQFPGAEITGAWYADSLSARRNRGKGNVLRRLLACNKGHRPVSPSA